MDLDIDVGVEGVLVEEDCTTCVMGEKLVVNVLNCFLQRDEVPCPRNLLLDGSFPSKVMTGYLPAIYCSKASSFSNGGSSCRC